MLFKRVTHERSFLFFMASFNGFHTKLVHAAEEPDPVTGAIAPILVRSKTFAQSGLGKTPTWQYSRGKNPTRSILEKKLALLAGGGTATVFSSGDAATTMFLLTLKPGDHILACQELYGGTVRLFDQLFARFQISVSYIDIENEEEIKKFYTKKTVAIWVESPTNPKLGAIDLQRVGALAKKYQLHYVADLTFAPPCVVQPFNYGIDTVIYSLSKYFAGHNDVIAGAIVTKDEKLNEKLEWLQWSVGACLSPDECYRVIQGLKTLKLRWDHVSQTADQVAAFLANQPYVKKVYHPTIVGHDERSVLARQMNARYGSVVGFDLATIDQKKLAKFVETLTQSNIVIYGESLASPETIIAHPASMSHRGMSEDQRRARGITSNFFRLSVGFEDSEDIIQALRDALSAI